MGGGWWGSMARIIMVIAEVITGILLGPSVMGFVPGFTLNIFPSSSITIFNGALWEFYNFAY